MSYLGDYAEDYTSLNFKFTSRKFSTGEPHPISGVGLSVYKQGSATESTAGITLSLNYDSRNGLNDVVVDLSSDSFYETNKDYEVIVNSGLIDGVSVAGETIALFSIENRTTFPKADYPTAFSTLDIDISGRIDASNSSLTTLVNQVPSGVWSQSVAAYQVDGTYGELLGSMGYVDGYVYVHPTLGSLGTTVRVNGTLSNPSPLLSQAWTIAQSLGNKAIRALPTGGDAYVVPSPLTIGGANTFKLDINGTQFSDINNLDFTNVLYESIFSSTVKSLITDSASFSTGRLGYYHNLRIGIPQLNFNESTFSYCDFEATELFPTTNPKGLFYACSFDDAGAGVAFNLTNAHASNNTFLHDCYGNIHLKNMTKPNQKLSYYGWGKLLIEDSCVSGTILHTSHVELFDGNGNPYSGNVITELVSEAGGVDIIGSGALYQINNEILDVLTTDTLIDGKTFQEALQIVGAVLAGKITDAGQATETFIGLDGSTTRVTVTVDSSGNRSNVVYS